MRPSLPWVFDIKMGYPSQVDGFLSELVLGCFLGLELELLQNGSYERDGLTILSRTLRTLLIMPLKGPRALVINLRL